ncbi:caspase-3-like isoform X2 [Littorina saxatilis]|uniref:Caspase-3 n=1 Tax=Littorina saxatilis TaxID=31220 RepID=A0AAN9GJJ0_9CAEN
MATAGKDTTDASGGPGNTATPAISAYWTQGRAVWGALTASGDTKHCYKMDHARRGRAIIINNETFHHDLYLGQRTGTDRDAENMESLLSELGFDITARKNCTAAEMKSMLVEAARESQGDADCFVCVILSHGDDGAVYGTDESVKVEDLVAPIKACKSLAGKPKLFFIQACRGKFVDGGVEVVDSKGKHGQDDEEEMESDEVAVQTIPVEADFLMAYSVAQGYYSWRNREQGSWFVQAVVKVVRDNWRRMDLLTMMTRVSHKVAYDFESNVPSNRFLHMKKQIPCITSMLTKDLYFTPKV